LDPKAEYGDVETELTLIWGGVIAEIRAITITKKG
jgi:hypothetical protein